MQVLGDLVKLTGAHPLSLPLPWWHRAPLGLITGTSVYVAILKPMKRPVGDIIISVLNPDKWENMLRVECKHEDRPGVIHMLLHAVRDLNIALGEAVTVETGSKLSSCFICEAPGTLKAGDFVARITGELKAEDFSDVDVRPFSLMPLKIHQPCYQNIRVDHGWLHGIDWRDRFGRHFPEVGRQRPVDLNRVVVSADTEKRLLRYVFPLAGAITVTIRHKDAPGALRALSNALKESGANVLSALLRRSKQPMGYAEYVAVCEPEGGATAALKGSIEEQVAAVDPIFDTKLKMNDGREPDKVVTIPESEDQEYSGRLPVLLWQRHVEGELGKRVLTKVTQVLRDNGCCPIESGGGPFGSSASLPPRAWMSRGVIVPVVGATASDEPKFCLDVATDLGLLLSLAKPLLLLVEGEKARGLETWPLPGGVSRQILYPGDEAASFNRLGRELAPWVGCLEA